MAFSGLSWKETNTYTQVCLSEREGGRGGEGMEGERENTFRERRMEKEKYIVREKIYVDREQVKKMRASERKTGV